MQKRVRAVFIRDGKILLIHRIKQQEEYFVFPGGGVEENDVNPQAALIRECFEEVGVRVKVQGVFFKTENETFYSCRITGGVVGTGKGPEFRKRTKYSGKYIFEWISMGDMGKLRVLPEELKQEILKRGAK